MGIEYVGQSEIGQAILSSLGDDINNADIGLIAKLYNHDLVILSTEHKLTDYDIHIKPMAINDKSIPMAIVRAVLDGEYIKLYFVFAFARITYDGKVRRICHEIRSLNEKDPATLQCNLFMPIQMAFTTEWIVSTTTNWFKHSRQRLEDAKYDLNKFIISPNNIRR